MSDIRHLATVHANGVVPVSVPLLLVAATPLLCFAFAAHRLELGIESHLLVGLARCFAQLMVLGSVLTPIFLKGLDWPWLVFLYVSFMICVGARESISRPKYTFRYAGVATLAALLITVPLVGTFAFLVVIRPTPLWDPQYIIPICGMLMGNCINGVSLAVNNLSTAVMEGGRREIELYLSFGASGWESLLRLVKAAAAAGTTPQLNSMNVIGLVSIPGMMTGQILGGSPVTEAAHYQIMIAYLGATCTFGTIFINMWVIYRVAFDVSNHVLRTDRFIEVVKDKRNVLEKTKTFVGIVLCGAQYLLCCCCFGPLRKKGEKLDAMESLEQQPLVDPGGLQVANRIKISTNRFSCDTDSCSRTESFTISGLQFSVPKSHTKRRQKSNPPSRNASYSSLPSAARSSPDTPLQRILCTDLNACLQAGEIGIVQGPSGSGKSTLLRVLAGLTPIDKGDVTAFNMSLASISSVDGCMLSWRAAVRYVTQYKVDIPGTPRDFIARLANCREYTKPDLPSFDQLVASSQTYLFQWSNVTDIQMNSIASYTNPEAENHPYLDKEWKTLSGGESQRVLLAISLASQPKVLLLDEATSGLDIKTEKIVEKSIIEYTKEKGAVVLWVTHDEDVAERLLSI